MAKTNQRRDHRRIQRFYPLPAALLALTALFIVSNPARWAERPRAAFFDFYQILHPRPAALASQNGTAPVVVIDIDSDSRLRFGAWPWPRTRLAELTQRVRSAGARVIAFDMVFAGRDQTSPEQMMETWWNRPGMADLIAPLSRLPDHDAVFAESLQGGDAITGFAPSNAAGALPPPLKAPFEGSEAARALTPPAFSGAIGAIPSLSQSSAGTGAVTLTPASSGAVRNIPLTVRIGDTLYPSLVLETLRLWRGARGYEIKTNRMRGTAPFASIKTGAIDIPITRAGEMRLYDSRTDTTPVLPAWRVLSEGFDGSRLQGALVLIGASADDGAQTYNTPLDAAAPGVVIKARALRQIMSGQFLTRPDWALWAELGAMALAGLLIIIATYKIGLIWAGLLTLFSVGGAAAGSFMLFKNNSWLVDPLWPSIGVLLSYTLAALIAVIRMESEKSYVRKAFGNYLFPGAVTELAKSTSQLNFSGESRTATIMFCDIRGLTPVEEAFRDAPRELVALISEFLTSMSRHIDDAHGAVNRYIGDQIMAVWNAPLDDDAHERHACECALRMLESLDKLNERLEALSIRHDVTYTPIHLGIGINSGDCTAGIMGSDLRDDYSVLGRPVRTASRLHRYSEHYGPAIIIGESTYSAVHHSFALLEIDVVEMEGREDPMRVFALLGNPVMKANPRFRALEEAHEKIFKAYRNRDWDGALAQAQATRSLSGAMPTLYELYENRILHFQHNPPGEKWIGAFTAPLR